jgi:carbamoyltransferase
MIICGLKLTHDGAVALIENGKLIFSIELEKLNNNKRFTSIEENSIIANILNNHDYSLSDVDFFVVDGWGGTDQDALAIQPRLQIGDDFNILTAWNKSEAIKLSVAPYREKSLKDDVIHEWKFKGLGIGNYNFEYLSYLHVAGHIMSTYCTSPFSKRNQSSYVLVWDGGMYPRLYFCDAKADSIENLGPIFLLIGNIYTIFSQHFGPFKVNGNFAKDNLSVAGKVMAYIALGKVRRELFKIFDDIYVESYDIPMGFANLFANEFKKKVRKHGYSDEDILCTFHFYLQELLLNKLVKKVKRTGCKSKNLCITGGCALNIKWNSAIRGSGYFNEVYVPPFPNDSGSAIGMACCAMFKKTPIRSLNWSVYSSPGIVKNSPAMGWKASECDLKRLAKLLFQRNEPVVFLNDKAELGPRALGNRSILASAASAQMKDILNKIKMRENYRPVSPICLEQDAQYIFDPGTRDPYMLFDHRLRDGWQDKIPAVLHLDGTARLQTISYNDNPVVTDLLTEYKKLSGIPLLCNTSANFKGSGFFPDVFSATNWNKVNYVWCDNTLYEKENKIIF